MNRQSLSPNRYLTLVLAIVSLSAGCRVAHPGVRASTAAAEVVAPTLEELGLQPVSSAINPCDDFYQFACGAWLENKSIPEGRYRWDRYIEAKSRTEDQLRTIVEDPDHKTLAAFYGACLNESAIEEKGTSAVKPILDAAARVEDIRSLATALIEMHRHQIWAGFSLYRLQDMKDSTTNILYVDTGTLGLPGSEYYLSQSERFVEVRQAYESHIRRMLVLSGLSAEDANAGAAAAIAVETRFVQNDRPPHGGGGGGLLGIYHRVDRDGLAALAPEFPWGVYFEGLGRPELTEISAADPDAIRRFNELVTLVSPRDWGYFLRWQIVHGLTDVLPKSFRAEHAVLTALLGDRQGRRARSKHCLGMTGAHLTDIVAQAYIDRAFPPATAEAATAMFEEVRAVFDDALVELDWMAPSTKREARAKLSAMTAVVGHPDRWAIYDFDVLPDNYAANILASRRHRMRVELNKVGQPYDRGEWDMPAWVVQSNYNRLANRLGFAAGNLQAPFFDAEHALAVNFGAMGYSVAHELTHGFDRTGSEVDSRGSVRDWWSEQDAQRFERKGQCLVRQYSAYEVDPGVSVDGERTLNENIADLGGVKFAFRAYRRLRRDATDGPDVEGFDEDQQFFLAYAQSLCRSQTAALARREARRGVHAPRRFRVNGPLRNLPEFSRAFSCEAGTAMNPEHKCEVW